MQTHFTAEQLADPHTASAGKDPALLRALRLLHRDLPDLCRRPRRARQPARPHLSDQGADGDRPRAGRRRRRAARSLPVLLLLHDDLPLRRRLPAADRSRARRVETRYRRAPFDDRLCARCSSWLLPSRGRFRLALGLAALGRPLRRSSRACRASARRLEAMLTSRRRACRRATRPKAEEFAAPSGDAKRRRVALLTGCAQEVLAPQINAATIRVLNRAGIDVVLPKGEGCCGSLAHHMGRERRARACGAPTSTPGCARSTARGWRRSSSRPRAAARRSRITAHCSPTIPLTRTRPRASPRWRRTPSEYLDGLDLDFADRAETVVAYHAACSLQHGQKILEAPKALLRRAGFDVRTPAEAHLCCGSAGVYNILQPRSPASCARARSPNLAAPEAGRHRDRQHRLHDADRQRGSRAGHPYDRVDRLGDGRTGASGNAGEGGAIQLALIVYLGAYRVRAVFDQMELRVLILSPLVRASQKIDC